MSGHTYLDQDQLHILIGYGSFKNNINYIHGLLEGCLFPWTKSIMYAAQISFSEWQSTVKQDDSRVFKVFP